MGARCNLHQGPYISENLIHIATQRLSSASNSANEGDDDDEDDEDDEESE